jgi:prophage DNA circulation protein
LTGFTGASQPTAQANTNPAATVATAIGLGAASRSAVTSAGVALQAAAAALSSAAPADYATAAQAYVQALQGAMVDPADAVRVLSRLLQLGPIQSTVTPVPWAPAAAMQSAANDMFRRAIVVSLANASSLYQPSSSNDAYKLMLQVVGALDTEIDIAGDQGEDDTFNALRAVSAAVVTDLTARGGSLPSIRLYTAAASQPAAVIAQRLYRDPSRANELVSEAKAIHPAFMPLSFSVLTS